MGMMSWLIGMGCEDMTPDEVRKVKGSGKVVLVDVRTPQEYASKKIDGAKLVPLQELESRVSEIPKDKEVILYCQNGIRSLIACRYLKKLGYSVKNMAGGISRW